MAGRTDSGAGAAVRPPDPTGSAVMSTLLIPIKHQARSALALAALAGLVCAILVLRLAMLLVDGVRVDYRPIPLSLQAPTLSAAGPVDWSLFGHTQVPDYGVETVLPATPLRLRLRGAVTGSRGYAIIIDEQGNEGVYRVDDDVPGAARVVAIEARRVVLERGGVREALALPDGAAARPAPARELDRSAHADANAYPAAAGIGSLTSMTSQFSLDPAELARRITILPVAGGGFRVRAGRDAAIFTQLGFHANDVVLAINGQPVDNQADVRAVFERWNPADPLAITVRRGDRQIVLTPGR